MLILLLWTNIYWLNLFYKFWKEDRKQFSILGSCMYNNYNMVEAHTQTHIDAYLFLIMCENQTLNVCSKGKYCIRMVLLGWYNFMTVDKSQIVVERVNTGNFVRHCLKSFVFLIPYVPFMWNSLEIVYKN